MNYSKQRELVEQVVKNNKIHPTADDVYLILKPDNPALSLGTVYRNLNTLAECGIIKKISIPNGSDRFDGEFREHYHIICDKCGSISDVDLSLLNELDEKIKEETGIEVTNHQLIINGICKKCQNTKEKKEVT